MKRTAGVVAALVLLAVTTGCNSEPRDVRTEELYGEWIGQAVFDRPAIPCDSRMSLRNDGTMTAERFPAEFDLVEDVSIIDAAGTWNMIRRDDSPVLAVNITDSVSKRGLVQQLSFLDDPETLVVQLVIGDPGKPRQVCRFRRTAA